MKPGNFIAYTQIIAATVKRIAYPAKFCKDFGYDFQL